MAILTTGPLLVPTFVQAPPDPCNVLVVTLSNRTNQVLQGSLRIDQVIYPADPCVPNQVCTVTSNVTSLLPGEPWRLNPNTVSEIRVPLPLLDPPARAVMVTVIGDVAKSASLATVSVSGGYAPPNQPLALAEATLLVRHEEFVFFPSQPI